MSRMSIEIDHELLANVMRRHGFQTTTEAVDVALRSLAGRPLSAAEALAMRGANLIDVMPADTQP
jgi:Arc/MetJ family transcription regulator